MDINFELYKIFYHAAKEKSFTKAGDNIFISQSAVSQAVKNLEEKTGVQLFIRNSRKIKLTTEGEMLFKHVEQAYNFIKSGENKLLEMNNLETGEVRIGASDTVCKYHLIPFMQKFNKTFPNIKIQFINRTSSQIISILKSGQIDFGIVTLPVNDQNITIQEFLSVEDVFVASGRFIDLKNQEILLEELNHRPLLMLEKNSRTRLNVERLFHAKGLNLKPEVELESVDLLVEFARIGLGIAHVLKESALALIEDNKLFEIKIKDTLPLRKLGIVSMENVPLSKASKEFINLLIEK